MQTLGIILEPVFRIMKFHVVFIFQVFLKFLLLPERRHYVNISSTERREANKQDEQEE